MKVISHILHHSITYIRRSTVQLSEVKVVNKRLRAGESVFGILASHYFNSVSILLYQFSSLP